MRNYLFEGYKKLDQTLVNGAHALAKGWNWLTGDSKSEFAKKLNTLAWMGIIANDFNENTSLSNLFFIPSDLLGWYVYRNINNNIEKRESDSSNKLTRDIYSEWMKGFYSFTGPLFLIFSIQNFLEYNNIDKIKNPYIDPHYTKLSRAIGYLFLSISMYVMRGEQIPPRKDFITRGIEKLVEASQSSKTTEQTPMLLTDRNYLLNN